MAQFGATTAFNRSVPFSEVKVLKELTPYLLRTLNLVDAEVFLIEDAKTKEAEGIVGFTKSIIESAEPGSPSFEFRNV